MKKLGEDLELLEWSIKSRARNQASCLALLKLFDSHPEFWKSKKGSRAAQDLVAVAFSLWRAAFLAEKTGKRSEVFTHGRDFLAKVIEDNAISYVQDKASREWTFNFYTKNARSSLTIMSNYWKEVPAYKGATRSPRERWDYCQDLLELAVNNFTVKLDAIRAERETRSKEIEERQSTRKGARERRKVVRQLTLSQRKSNS